MRGRWAAYMCEDLLGELPPLALIELLREVQDTTAALEAVASHFKFVHGVDVLDVHLDARTVRRLRCPYVEILVATCLKVEGVVAVVQVCELGQEIEVVFGVQFRIWGT